MFEDVTLNFGFKDGPSGAHSSRTMMFSELELLFAYLGPNSKAEDYQNGIENLNLLNKPTSRSRNLTWKHLQSLYGMDPAIPLFRIFRQLWEVDEQARTLLACQMALTRDPILRMSVSKLKDTELGNLLSREDMVEIFEKEFPNRFSQTSLESMAKNVNATWTNAGFLKGKSKKYRTEPNVRAVNIAFALLLGYVQGISGNRLFTTQWVNLLQCRTERLYELARVANDIGLISFKHSSEVVDITFSNLITREEEAWLSE